MPTRGEIYRATANQQTRGGLSSLAKLTQDLDELHRLIDQLPDRLLEFARADPRTAEEKAVNYLLRKVEPEVRNVTQDHFIEEALLLLRDESFQLMLFERGEDGGHLRSWLKEFIDAGHGQAVEHMADRGQEYQPIVQVRQGASQGMAPKIPEART